jgi:hypothetical protein
MADLDTDGGSAAQAAEVIDLTAEKGFSDGRGDRSSGAALSA